MLPKHRQCTGYYTVPKLLPAPQGTKFLSFTNSEALHYILNLLCFGCKGIFSEAAGKSIPNLAITPVSTF